MLVVLAVDKELEILARNAEQDKGKHGGMRNVLFIHFLSYFPLDAVYKTISAASIVKMVVLQRIPGL